MNYCYALSLSSTPTDYRYIGETNNLDYRLYTHLYTAKTSEKRWPLLNWITKHINMGEEILLTPICVSERDTYEIALIARARLLGWNLLNIQDGGTTSGSMRGKVHSEESKKRMSLVRKGRPQTEEHKRNRAKALSGLPKSESHRRNMSGPKHTIKCPHCEIVGGVNNMSRWHFNNCRKGSRDGYNIP